MSHPKHNVSQLPPTWRNEHDEPSGQKAHMHQAHLQQEQYTGPRHSRLTTRPSCPTVPQHNLQLQEALGLGIEWPCGTCLPPACCPRYLLAIARGCMHLSQAAAGALTTCCAWSFPRGTPVERYALRTSRLHGLPQQPAHGPSLAETEASTGPGQ